jgi:predicted transcriptional regulator
MSAIKEELNSLLERLPADASIEDIQYHLYVIDKVQKGLESVERKRRLTQEQVEARLSKWLIS